MKVCPACGWYNDEHDPACWRGNEVQAELWPADPGDGEQRRTVKEILSEGITAAVVKELLRLRHAEPVGAWAYFPEFTPGIGYASPGVETRIDAWAMNVWPSNGYTTIAYEIKVSRSDFLRELKDPDKRAWALRFSDEFYFVAPRHLIHPKELPPECGLIEVTKVTVKGNYKIDGQRYTMRATVKAPKRKTLKDLDRDARPTWHLLAAVARRACRAENEAKPTP